MNIVVTFINKLVYSNHNHGQRSGGGGGGDVFPHDLEGRDIISNVPPPPHDLFVGCIIIHWNEDPFFFFHVIFFFWGGLVREVGDLQWVPPLCVWEKLTNKFWGRKKKCRSNPPPLITFFQDLRDFQLMPLRFAIVMSSNPVLYTRNPLNNAH